MKNKVGLKKLGQYVSLRQGLAINASTEHLISDKCDEQFCLPLLRIADMVDNSYTRFISKDVQQSVKAFSGDIIYTRTGQIGLVFTNKTGVVHNNSFIVDLVSNELDKKYLFTILQSSFVRNQALELAKNSVQPDLTHDMFKSIEIPVPHIDEQKKIAKIYCLLNDAIVCNSLANNNLEQQLRFIYDYWFTQFDFPDENGKPYRTSGGKMVWNDELKHEIPDGWSAASIISNPLSTVIKPGVTRFDRKTYFATADVNGRNILDGTIISFEGRESRANMQPTINSIWFAKMKNSIKHLILNTEMKELIDNSVLSTGFFGLQVQENAFEYMASFIDSGYFENRKDILAHGATQEAVNNDDLGTLYFVIPDAKTLQAFHKATRGIYAKISQNIIENRKLQKLRDWLLPMLMNGKATVAD